MPLSYRRLADQFAAFCSVHGCIDSGPTLKGLDVALHQRCGPIWENVMDRILRRLDAMPVLVSELFEPRPDGSVPERVQLRRDGALAQQHSSIRDDWDGVEEPRCAGCDQPVLCDTILELGRKYL